MFHRYFTPLAGCAFACLITEAQAGIALSATRLVYHASDQEVSLVVRNNTPGEILLQSWLEPDVSVGAAVPFVITPALAHMNGRSRQTLRIIYAGAGLPLDRESVAWLNVQEIPQKSTVANTLQIAIRQRIKVFFRPAGLGPDVRLAADKLRWQLDGSAVQVTNPGPYHVSMAGLSFEGLVVPLFTRVSDMVGPFQTRRLALKGGQAHPAFGAVPVLRFSRIDDHGARLPYRVTFDHGQSRQTLRVP